MRGGIQATEIENWNGKIVMLIETRKNICQMRDEQLRAKDKIIMANQGEGEAIQRKLEATMAELEGTRRERDSAKQQVHDCHNALAKNQEKLNTKERELDDVKAKLESAQHEVDALRLVNDKNGAHNAKLQASAEKAKSTLAKERKGL